MVFVPPAVLGVPCHALRRVCLQPLSLCCSHCTHADLFLQAAAKLKMEITSKPLALDEIDRRVLQLEMERLSLSKAAPSDKYLPTAHATAAHAVIASVQCHLSLQVQDLLCKDKIG